MVGVKQANRAVLLLLTQGLIARCAADFGDRISLSGDPEQTIAASSSNTDNAIPQNVPAFEGPSEGRGDSSGATLAAPAGFEGQPSAAELGVQAGKGKGIAGDEGPPAPRWPPLRARSRPRPLRSRSRGREQSSQLGGGAGEGSRRDPPPLPSPTKEETGTRTTPNSSPVGSRLRYNRYATRPAGGGRAPLQRARGNDGGSTAAEVRSEATGGRGVKVDAGEHQTYSDANADYSHANPSKGLLPLKEGAERGDADGSVEGSFSKIYLAKAPRAGQKHKGPTSSKSAVVGEPSPPADDVAAAATADEREIEPNDAEPKHEEKLAAAPGQSQPPALTQRETEQNRDTVREAVTRARNDNGRFEQATLDKSQFETVLEPLTSHRLDMINVSTTMSNTEFLLDSKIFDKVYSPFTLPSVPAPIGRETAGGQDRDGRTARREPPERMTESGRPLTAEGYTQIDHPKMRDYFHEARHKPSSNGDKPSDEKFHKLIYESTQDIIERASLEERRKALFKPHPSAHHSQQADGIGGKAITDETKVRAFKSNNRNTPPVTPRPRVDAGTSFSFMTIRRFPLDSGSEDAHAVGSTTVPVYSIPPAVDLYGSGSEIDLQTQRKDPLEGLRVNNIAGDREGENDRERTDEIEGEIDTLFSPLDYLLEEHGISDETFGKPTAAERLRPLPRPTGHFGETEEDQRIIEEARAGLDIPRLRDPETQERRRSQTPSRGGESSREHLNEQHRFDSPIRSQPVKRENGVKFDTDVPGRQQAANHQQNHAPRGPSRENKNQKLVNSNEKFEKSETNQVAAGLSQNDPPTIKNAGSLPSLQQFDETQGETLRSILPFFRAPLPPHPHARGSPPPPSRLPPRLPRRDIPPLSPRPFVKLAPLPSPALLRPPPLPRGRESFGRNRVANEVPRLPSALVPPVPPAFGPLTEPPLHMRPPALIIQPTPPPQVLPPLPTPDGQVRLPAMIDTVPPFSDSLEAQNMVDVFPPGARPFENGIEGGPFKSEDVGSASRTSFTKRPRIEFNEFHDLIDFELNRTPQDNLAKDLVSREGGSFPRLEGSSSTANDFLKPPPSLQRPTPLVPPPPPPFPSARKPLTPFPLGRPEQSRPEVPLPRPSPSSKGRMEKPFQPPQVLVNDIPLAFTTRGPTFSPVHINVPGHVVKIPPPGGIRPPNQQAILGNKPSLLRENRSPTQTENGQRNNLRPPAGFGGPRPGVLVGFQMKLPRNQLSPPPPLRHGAGALPGPRPAAVPLPKENLAVAQPVRSEKNKPNVNGVSPSSAPVRNFDNLQPLPSSHPPQTAVPSTPPVFRAPPPPPPHPLPSRSPLFFHIPEIMSPPPPPPPRLPEFHPRPPPFHPSTNVPTIPKPAHFPRDDFDAPPRNEHQRDFPQDGKSFDFQNSLEFQGTDTRNRVRFPSGNELESDFIPVHDVSQPLPPMILQPRLSESHAKMMRNLRYGVNGEPLDIWIPIQVTGRSQLRHSSDVGGAANHEPDYHDSFGETYDYHDGNDYGDYHDYNDDYGDYDYHNRRSDDANNDAKKGEKVVPKPRALDDPAASEGPRFDVGNLKGINIVRKLN
ncbi:uncharacterized protein LOC125026857 [Penaeus chinensis]|uniref:uncharacterized protein LOC125026857 n=1 Tax=Penaeus chinensis TaxID=139456 RepID=UPI001FB72B67|nr:uncharacterized protein LOC125026857 [Penaeus chinensis]